MALEVGRMSTNKELPQSQAKPQGTCNEAGHRGGARGPLSGTG